MRFFVSLRMTKQKTQNDTITYVILKERKRLKNLD
jgi:hypothetical protein